MPRPLLVAAAAKAPRQCECAPSLVASNSEALLRAGARVASTKRQGGDQEAKAKNAWAVEKEPPLVWKANVRACS